MTIGKTITRGDWLELRQTVGKYEYVHQSRMGPDAVAVLAYRSTLVLGRFEVCPAHGDGEEPALCALTGGVEEGETFVEAAQRELYEESGVAAPLSSFRSLQSVRPSKASDTTIYFFCVPLPEEYTTKSRDQRFFGPGGPGGGYCKLLPMHTALWSKDPLLVTMIARRRAL